MTSSRGLLRINESHRLWRWSFTTVATATACRSRRRLRSNAVRDSRARIADSARLVPAMIGGVGARWWRVCPRRCIDRQMFCAISTNASPSALEVAVRPRTCCAGSTSRCMPAIAWRSWDRALPGSRCCCCAPPAFSGPTLARSAGSATRHSPTRAEQIFLSLDDRQLFGPRAPATIVSIHLHRLRRGAATCDLDQCDRDASSRGDAIMFGARDESVARALASKVVFLRGGRLQSAVRTGRRVARRRAGCVVAGRTLRTDRVRASERFHHSQHRRRSSSAAIRAASSGRPYSKVKSAFGFVSLAAASSMRYTARLR